MSIHNNPAFHNLGQIELAEFCVSLLERLKSYSLSSNEIEALAEFEFEVTSVLNFCSLNVQNSFSVFILATYQIFEPDPLPPDPNGLCPECKVFAGHLTTCSQFKFFRNIIQRARPNPSPSPSSVSSASSDTGTSSCDENLILSPCTLLLLKCIFFSCLA